MQKEKEAKQREQEHADAVRRQWQAQGKDALGTADDPELPHTFMPEQA